MLVQYAPLSILGQSFIVQQDDNFCLKTLASIRENQQECQGKLVDHVLS